MKTTTKKRCKRCEVVRPISQFNLRAASTRKRCRTPLSKYRNECNFCRREKDISCKLHKHGITLKEYEELYTTQRGCCAICRERKKSQVEVMLGKSFKDVLHVDHDHETGEVRGLLCYNCNIGVGNMKDSVKNLQEAIRYLKECG